MMHIVNVNDHVTPSMEQRKHQSNNMFDVDAFLALFLLLISIVFNFAADCIVVIFSI